MNGVRGLGAMPEGHNGIRVRFDIDEPPALVFHEKALPGALVSWAWCQLRALDSLLDAIIVTRRPDPGEPDVAGAVQAILVPVINALAFSEQRAHELQSDIAAARPAKARKKVSRKEKKSARP